MTTLENILADVANAKTFEFDGQTWTADKVRENRETLITVRDAAIAQGSLDWAVPISHSIMLLDKLADLMKAEQPEARCDVCNEPWPAQRVGGVCHAAINPWPTVCKGVVRSAPA